MEPLYIKIKKGDCKCCICDNTFTIADIETHIIKYHPNESRQCRDCKQLFASWQTQNKHRKECREKYSYKYNN